MASVQLTSTLQAETLPPALQDLALEDALRISVEQSPDLIAIRMNDAAGRAAVGTSRVYPFNPYVQVQVLPYGREANGEGTSVHHYVLLMQTLELAHQQRFRERTALANLSRAQWTIHQAELSNVAQTERLFFQAIYLRELRDQLRAIADLNASLLDVLTRRFEAGQALDADVSLARMQAMTLRQQAEVADANYQTAALELTKQLGMPFSSPLQPAGKLSEWRWRSLAHASTATGQVGRNALTVFDAATLAIGRPDVMAAQADIQAARAALGLARGVRIPNLQTGPFYERDDAGTTLVGLRAQIDAPVINNGRSLVNQRRIELRAREIAHEQLVNKARLEVEAAIDRYERALRLAERSAGGFDSTLQEQLHRIEEQYEAGQIDVLRLFVARSALLQGQRAQLDVMSELAQAAAGLTAVAGIPPQALIARQEIGVSR